MRYSILILVIGAVASEPFFSPGQEYEFDYKGKIMTGIPELDKTHFAGLTLEGKVILQAHDSQNFKLALKDVRFNNFNMRLTDLEDPEWSRRSSSREDEDDPSEYGWQSQNWRNLKTPDTVPVPHEFQTILESPVEFSIVNGEIRSVKVSRDEADWSVNFKKALVSLMKVQTPAGHHDLSHNSVRSHNGSLPRFWKTMEEGVDGKCENIYTVTDVPQYKLQEITPSIVLDMGRCEGQKVFEILKTRNINKCVKRSVYQTNQPGRHLCLAGNCDSMWQRNSMTRYIACGSSEDDMELQVILNEGELQQDLLAFNTESLVTGTKQTLKMIEIRDTLSTLPQIRSPRNLDDLLYEYPQNVSLERKQNDRDNSNFKDQQEKLQNQPITSQRFKPSLDDSVTSKLSPETLKQKIIDLLTQVARDLTEVEELGEKHIPQTILSISKIFSLLNTEQMKSLYNQVKGLNIDSVDKETMRQLVLEISVTCGTSPAFMFIKEMIQSNEFSPIRIGVALSTLPHYIRTPTVELLDQFFELVKSPVVTKNLLVKANAQLAFATLVNRACIDSYRGNRFPVFVFGEFCSSQTSEVTTKYIPYFVDQLKSNDNKERESVIVTLGTLGHESVIPILLPFIEGKDEKVTPLEQRFAIYSLMSVAHKHRDVLLPAFSAITHNPSEDRDVRIAALSEMLKMKPSMAYFQKLATSTWFEKDNEFHKFVYSTLKSLSEIENSEHPDYDQPLFSNSKKASTVLPLAKPLPGIISSTLNHFTADWLHELEVGYSAQGFMSTTSTMQQAYGRIDYFLEQLQFTPIEFCFNMHGTGEMIDAVNRIFGSESSKDKVHPEWRDIISSINLQPMENSPFSAGSWTKIFDDINFLYGLRTSDVEAIARNVKKSVSQPSSIKEKICGLTPINVLKVNNPAPTEILIPSDMGMPIIIDFQSPIVGSLKGELNIDCKTSSLPTISLQVTHKASVAYTGHVGTMCPFTKEVILVGMDQHTSINLPVQISTRMELGKLKLVFTKNNAINPSADTIDLWSYTVKPFAIIKPVVYVDATPFMCHKNTKIIRSESERKEHIVSLGESLGLDLKHVITSETDILDIKSLMDHFALYNYSPANMILFSWTQTAMQMDGKPSIRQHAVKMTYNLKRSSTSKIEIGLSVGLAYKSENERPYTIEISKSQDESILINKQQLQSSDSTHKKLEQILQRINVQAGYGVNIDLDIHLNGNTQKTYSYSLSAGQGTMDMEQKWSIHLGENDRMNLCIDGGMHSPIISWRAADQLRSEDVKFSYNSIVGFGNLCQEHSVKITGTTSVSEEQNRRGSGTESSIKCKENTKKAENIQEELKTISQKNVIDRKKLQDELEKTSEIKANYCNEEVHEHGVLDNVNFRIEYSSMPEDIENYVKYLDTVIKGLLAPFISKYEERKSDNEIDIDLKFNDKINTVDMIMTTEDGTVLYENIRLPGYIGNILPLNALDNVREKIVSAVYQDPVYPECTIGDDIVNTFDNKTYHYELDDCYHVLASDCSIEFTHAVLGKKINDRVEIIVFTHGSKMEIRPSQSYSDSRKEYDIDVDGKSVSLAKGEKAEVDSIDNRSSYRFQRSSDDVVFVETPYSRITYDVKKISIEHTKLSVDNKHCGLCGDATGDKRADVKTAQSCVAQNPQSAALTYRIPQGCSAQSKHWQQQQQQQSNKGIQCKEQKIESSPVTQSLKGQLGKCSQMKHSMLKQAGRQGEVLCISQTSILECGSGCAPRAMIRKNVSFTCLPAGRDRVMRLYEEKVRRGDSLPELRNMEETFSAEMELPVSCTHPGI